MSSTLEAFLLIEQPRQRLGHWTAALASLDSHICPTPTQVVAYYDPSSDQALLALQYDEEQVGPNRLEFVMQVALLAEVGMVQPAELSEGDRMRFLAARLARCTIRVMGQTNAIGALNELVRRIKDERAEPSKIAKVPPPVPAAKKPRVPMPAPRVPPPPPPQPVIAIPPVRAARVIDPLNPPTPVPLPRGPSIEDPLITAKGTRDNLERLSTDELEVIPDIDIDDMVIVPRMAPADMDRVLGTDVNDMQCIPTSLLDVPLSQRLPTVDLGRPPTEAEISPPPTYVAAIEGVVQTSRHVVVRSSRYSTLEIDPAVRDRLKSESEDDRITSPMNLDKLQEISEAELAKSPRRLRPPSENDFAEEDDVRPVTVKAPSLRPLASTTKRAGSEPYVTVGQQPNIIYARYLRGGRWVPVRVGALSLNGAALLAGALPRLDDRVDVAFTFEKQRALVRGTVAKVSTRGEAAQTGASTFTVTFNLDNVSRKQLTALLLAARDAKITIKPPPPRATRRFPVEWQVALATLKGAIKSHALDVSTGGMFVRSPVPLELGTTANFSVVLDDGGSPIGGRARVVRKITDTEARACGLTAGFGLEIVDMSEADRMRWLGFLARIERRAEKRVLIGADPARFAELQAGLASLGYAVCGGTDPGTLVQLANGDARPADAVLIDAGWLQNESSTTLVESLFSARNVPCVTMHGEVRRARQAIDRLLEVVV